jgi:ketosteroid isomerase-like protein
MTSIPDLARMQEALLGAPDPHIVTLEARIRAAQLGADVAALDQLLSEDLLFTGPDGQLGTKVEDLAAHGSGTVRFCAHEPEELRIRRIGAHVAVSALRARLTVDVAGARVQGTFRYTRVWAQEDDGAWRVVGGHVSLLPPAAPADPAAPAV